MGLIVIEHRDLNVKNENLQTKGQNSIFSPPTRNSTKIIFMFSNFILQNPPPPKRNAT